MTEQPNIEVNQLERPAAPEHTKLAARRTEAAVIAGFLGFVEGYGGFKLCVWDAPTETEDARPGWSLPGGFSDEVDVDALTRAYLGVDEAAYQAECEALVEFVKKVHQRVHGSTPGGVFVGKGANG